MQNSNIVNCVIQQHNMTPQEFYSPLYNTMCVIGEEKCEIKNLHTNGNNSQNIVMQYVTNGNFEYNFQKIKPILDQTQPQADIEIMNEDAFASRYYKQGTKSIEL